MNAYAPRQIFHVVKIHIMICTGGSFGSLVKGVNDIRK